MDVRAILDHQYEAFFAGSADEILKDFAEDAVLIGEDGVATGRDAIHAVYAEMFSGLFVPGTYEFVAGAEHIHGEIAYITWSATCASANVTLGTDTFVVRNGKIVVQTTAAKIEPK
jgi:hypothetical protein